MLVQEYEYYTLIPEETEGSEDDIITTLNLPLIGVMEGAHSSSFAQLIVAILAGYAVVFAAESAPIQEHVHIFRPLDRNGHSIY
jgi:hypothetical protein